MSVSEVRTVWRECQDHVEKNLLHATSHEEMLLYVDQVCEYLQKNGHKLEVVKELKLLMTMRCFEYAQRLRSAKEQVTDFDPYTESYIVLPKHDVKRVIGLIESRNTQVQSKIVYRRGPP